MPQNCCWMSAVQVRFSGEMCPSSEASSSVPWKSIATDRSLGDFQGSQTPGLSFQFCVGFFRASSLVVGALSSFSSPSAQSSFLAIFWGGSDSALPFPDLPRQPTPCVLVSRSLTTRENAVFSSFGCGKRPCGGTVSPSTNMALFSESSRILMELFNAGSNRSPTYFE